jgi:hypothetical protein
VCAVVRRLLVLATLMAAAPSTAEADRYRLAIAVNEPLGWSEKIVAASFYVALAEHHVLRANVAHYATPGALFTDKLTAVIGEDNHDVERKGGYLDIGAGWQWYPRALWRGPTIELGALWRSDKTLRDDPADTSSLNEVHRDVKVVAARALVGWSWQFYDRVFIMAAAGGSIGYARGTETTIYDDETSRMPETARAPVAVAAFESYLRFGWTF